MFPDGVQRVQIYSMRHSRPLGQLHKCRQTVNQTDIRHCIDHNLHSKVFLVGSCISPLTLGIFDKFFNIFPYWNQIMWNYFPVLTDSSYSFVIFSCHVNLSTFWEQSPDFTALLLRHPTWRVERWEGKLWKKLLLIFYSSTGCSGRLVCFYLTQLSMLSDSFSNVLHFLEKRKKRGKKNIK